MKHLETVSVEVGLAPLERVYNLDFNTPPMQGTGVLPGEPLVLLEQTLPGQNSLSFARTASALLKNQEEPLGSWKEININSSDVQAPIVMCTLI